MKRRRFKQTTSLEECLADEQAQLLPPGVLREAIMKRGASGGDRIAHKRLTAVARTESAD